MGEFRLEGQVTDGRLTERLRPPVPINSGCWIFVTGARVDDLLQATQRREAWQRYMASRRRAEEERALRARQRLFGRAMRGERIGWRLGAAARVRPAAAL